MLSERTQKELRREYEIGYWRLVNMLDERKRIIREIEQCQARVQAWKVLLESERTDR